MGDRRALVTSQLARGEPVDVDQVRGVDTATMTSLLGELGLPRETVDELRGHWDEMRRSTPWSSLLATMVASVERDRGHIDTPLVVFDDFDDHGTSGRLIAFYLFALQYEGLRTYHQRLGVPEDVSLATARALARHAETHRLKHATTGIDAAWWMQTVLRGEILQVGNLKFHHFRLGVSTLSPRPWLDEAEIVRLGEGFRHGDFALGVHIPARVDISRPALDATFERARDVITWVWPSPSRRVATCQSWMMDERLGAALGDDSNIVGFQRRFTLIDPFDDDEGMVRYFVFGPRDGAAGPVTASRLQRVVGDVLSRGERWHNRTGWLEFD